MVLFGIQLPGLLPMALYPHLARLIESYGFDWVGVPDQLLQKPAWPILDIVALNTSRVALGPNVTNPFSRHPAVTASHIAVLDELSAGRAFVGLGLGSTMERIRLPQDRPVRALREAVRIINSLLEGDGAGFKGEVFSLAPGTRFRYEPPRRRVPIYFGVSGQQMLRLAGQIADGVITPMWHGKVVHLVRETVRQGALAAQRSLSNIEISVYAWTSIGYSQREVLDVARKHLAVYLPLLGVAAELAEVPGSEIEAVRVAWQRGDSRAAAEAISLETIQKLMAVGSPEEVAEQTQKVMGLGVDRIVFAHPLGPDIETAIRLLGERVLPAIKQPLGDTPSKV